MHDMYGYFPQIVKNGWLKTVSFDNLAISQLNIKRLMSEQEWKIFYMGDDGRDGELSSASMYVDAVFRSVRKILLQHRAFPYHQ